MALFAGRSRRRIRSFDRGVCARCPDRSGLAYSASRPQEPDISLLAARVRVVPILLALMAGLAIYAFSQFYLPVWVKLVIGVAIGGVALVPVFIGGKIGRSVVLWVAALLLLGFCVLTGFSVGVFFLPSALLSLSLATVFSFSKTAD
jgi:hypothetical protein